MEPWRALISDGTFVFQTASGIDENYPMKNILQKKKEDYV